MGHRAYRTAKLPGELQAACLHAAFRWAFLTVCQAPHSLQKTFLSSLKRMTLQLGQVWLGGNMDIVIFGPLKAAV